jgi:hypothetical protein
MAILNQMTPIVSQFGCRVPEMAGASKNALNWNLPDRPSDPDLSLRGRYHRTGLGCLEPLDFVGLKK